MTIVDSDILTLVEQNKPPYAARAAAAAGGVLHIALVTRIERLRGRFDAVLKATPVDLLVMQRRLADTEAFLARFRVVYFDDVAVTHFARLSVVKPTRSMGRDDLLIACIALAHSATLATRNTRDFRLVPGLELENWAD